GDEAEDRAGHGGTERAENENPSEDGEHVFLSWLRGFAVARLRGASVWCGLSSPPPGGQVGKPALHGPPPGVQVGKPALHRGQVGKPALHRPRATEQPRNRATRYRATASSVLDPFGAFHHLPQRFLIDWMSLRGSLVLVVVRDHEAAALEISVAQHRPFDDDADVRAEHLRRH